MNMDQGRRTSGEGMESREARFALGLRFLHKPRRFSLLLFFSPLLVMRSSELDSIRLVLAFACIAFWTKVRVRIERLFLVLFGALEA